MFCYCNVIASICKMRGNLDCSAPGLLRPDKSGLAMTVRVYVEIAKSVRKRKRRISRLTIGMSSNRDCFVVPIMSGLLAMTNGVYASK